MNKKTCKFCGRYTEDGKEYCTTSCMKDKARELRVQYWDLVKQIRDRVRNKLS